LSIRRRRTSRAAKPDTGLESHFLPTLTCIRRPHRNIAMLFGTEKLEWLGYQMVKNFEDMFMCFDIMYERDRHTHRHAHRQTPHDGIGRD